MRTCLFEDRLVANFEPLVDTRPVFELLCGQTSLGIKQQWFIGSSIVGALIRPHLCELFRWRHPHIPTNDFSWLSAEPTVLVNGRFLPPDRTMTMDGEPHLGMVGDEVAYAVVTPHELRQVATDGIDYCLQLWRDKLPTRSIGGQMVHYLWDLVEANGEQMQLDFRLRIINQAKDIHHHHVAVIGPADQLLVDPTADMEPMVVIDTSNGPVVIGPNAKVTAFSRIEGPCYIGPGTQIIGAKIRGNTTIGPNCRIGGEVESSIFHGYSNKYHEGFFGHGYVGEWVNIAAGTHNSDLRSDYGEVSVPIHGTPVPTGLTKVGCFLGDHVKTGLGTLINTGSNIGVFANLLPAGILAPKYVPAFASWWKGEIREGMDLGKLLVTAARMMERRKCQLTTYHRSLYQQVYEQTAQLRGRIMQEPRSIHWSA